MGTLIKNAWLVSMDPPSVQQGDLRVADGAIAAIGDPLAAQPADQVVDARGAVVMPGLVNGHMHLYSALAVGMPTPPEAPNDFLQILERVWWRLDQALDLPACQASALVGGIEALRRGTTTLIDHHASPRAIDGSLDALEAGLRAVGLRGVLGYETTDRHGDRGRDAGLAENERYLKRRMDEPSQQFAGLVGGHAAFTLGDESLAAVADLARRFGVGVHMHAAEAPCDDALCRAHYGRPLLDRLDRAGILSLPSLLAHGTHLSEADLARVNASPVVLAHNPRSNMNNAVGYAPVAKVKCPVVLGTDGIGSDMLAELAAVWFKSRDARAGLTPSDCVAMLARSARLAGDLLGVKLGSLQPAAAADLLVTDYVPATPLTAENLSGHLIFGLSSGHVRSVMVAGRWRLIDRNLVDLDGQAVHRQATEQAARLWARMQAI